jgi:hypothetical protein
MKSVIATQENHGGAPSSRSASTIIQKLDSDASWGNDTEDFQTETIGHTSLTSKSNGGSDRFKN